jgi:hypothetical protein
MELAHFQAQRAQSFIVQFGDHTVEQPQAHRNAVRTKSVDRSAMLLLLHDHMGYRTTRIFLYTQISAESTILFAPTVLGQK